jgi:hypothetical protein
LPHAKSSDAANRSNSTLDVTRQPNAAATPLLEEASSVLTIVAELRALLERTEIQPR